jgi:hypothetical protein
MSWTLSTGQSWKMAAVPLPPITPTAVQPSSLTVTQHGDRNLLELKTEREAASLGFNLYREQEGTRVRLNASLLAGTALVGGRDTALTAGHVQTALDAPAGDSGSVSYWVEEVDVHGQRTWRGPVTPTAAAPHVSVSLGLSALAPARTRDAGEHVESLGRVGRAGAVAGTRGAAAPHALQALAAPRLDPANGLAMQYALAAGYAVKIGVRAEGWYRVAWPDLVAAGLDPLADARTLQLFAEGVEQPILVQGPSSTPPGTPPTIQFYGTGLDTTWSDTRVYWLTWGRGLGRRVAAESVPRRALAGPSHVPATAEANFPATVEWKPRTVYFAALLNGDADNFFGPVLTAGDPVDQALPLTHLDPSATADAQVRVALQGASSGLHSVAVALNGSQIGTLTFSGQSAGIATLAVPETVLQEGQNLLTLTVTGGQDDVSVVDRVELTYPHRYTADNDTLRFTAASGQAATIEGFSSAQILVVDITNPDAVTVVPQTLTQQGASYAVTVVPQGEGTRTLLVLTSAQAAQPASITAHQPSSWHAPQPGFDLVMISHADFVESLGPLVTVHQGEGRTVAVIDVEALYDEFNFGEKSPYAVKTFLSTATAQWRRKPRFVVLVGDATFDPRDYLGAGPFDFVPTYLVDTTLLETASDDWFADFSGQGLPQLAIGRLPVRTAQDAAAQVGKIVTYSQSGGAAWNKQVLVVADPNDSENNFEGYSAAIKALLPGDLTVSEIVLGSVGANLDLLNSLNVQGEAMVNYIGHGSEAVWGGGLFSSTDAQSLMNGAMVPFVVAMTCLNGYFQDVYQTALAKALIQAPGGGALAVWASSGLTDSGSQAAMNQALITALFGPHALTLGEAAATAKTVVSDLDVRRTWILFGDPAITLHQ